MKAVKVKSKPKTKVKFNPSKYPKRKNWEYVV